MQNRRSTYSKVSHLNLNLETQDLVVAVVNMVGHWTQSEGEKIAVQPPTSVVIGLRTLLVGFAPRYTLAYLMVGIWSMNCENIE